MSSNHINKSPGGSTPPTVAPAGGIDNGHYPEGDTTLPSMAVFVTLSIKVKVSRKFTSNLQDLPGHLAETVTEGIGMETFFTGKPYIQNYDPLHKGAEFPRKLMGCASISTLQPRHPVLELVLYR